MGVQFEKPEEAFVGCVFHFPSVGEIKVDQILGSGTYGVVYRCRLRSEANKRYALKYFRQDADDLGVSSCTLRELSAVRGLNHSNIVRCEAIFQGPQPVLTHRYNQAVAALRKQQGTRGEHFESLPPEYDHLLVAYELCEGGDLEKKIRSSPGRRLTLEDTKLFTFQLLNGLAHLHNSRVCHRDLKPANLLLTETGVLKIGDLGLCRDIRIDMGDITPTVCTIYYRPPEVLLGKVIISKPHSSSSSSTTTTTSGATATTTTSSSEGAVKVGAGNTETGGDGVNQQEEHRCDDPSHYGLAVDIWSVGCIMAEMLSGRPLFKGTEEFELYTRITSVLGTPTDEEWSHFSK